MDFIIYIIVGAALVLLLLFKGLPAFNRRFQGKNINPMQNDRAVHVDARFDDVIGDQMGFTKYPKAGITRYTLASSSKMDEHDGRPEDYVSFPGINRTVLVHKSIAEPFFPKLKEYSDIIKKQDQLIEFLKVQISDLERDPQKRVKETMQAANDFIKSKSSSGPPGGFKK